MAWSVTGQAMPKPSPLNGSVGKRGTKERKKWKRALALNPEAVGVGAVLRQRYLAHRREKMVRVSSVEDGDFKRCPAGSRR